MNNTRKIIWSTFGKGLIFGCGFAMSIFLIVLVLNMIQEKKYQAEHIKRQNDAVQNLGNKDIQPEPQPRPLIEHFTKQEIDELILERTPEMTLAQMIDFSTVIVYLKFRSSESGVMEAIVEEIIKNDYGSKFNYLTRQKYPFFNNLPVEVEESQSMHEGVLMLQSHPVNNGIISSLDDSTIDEIVALVNVKNDS